jgi:hypothetical protein
MSKKEDAAFQAWADELVEQVDPEEQEAFQSWIMTKSARETYRGYLREQDYHRRTNVIEEEKQKVAAIREELENWYEEEAPKNEALLRERDQLKAQLELVGSGAPPPAKGTPGVNISAQDLDEIRQNGQKAQVLDKLLPAVLGDISAVLKDSIKNDFDVDPREVIKLSLQQGIEPWRAYMNITAEERSSREEKAQEAERKKWFEEGRRAALTNNSPDHLQPSGPTVIDYLKTLNDGKSKESSRDDRLAASLREFAEGNFS